MSLMLFQVDFWIVSGYDNVGFSYLEIGGYFSLLKKLSKQNLSILHFDDCKWYFNYKSFG